MADALTKRKAKHPVEILELVQEIQDLINEKNLPVELILQDEMKSILNRQDLIVAGSCSQCTICPCMICW